MERLRRYRLYLRPGKPVSNFAKAKALIPAIVKKQTTNVDAVSGATYSSNGIIRAVRNALGKASTTSKKTENTEEVLKEKYKKTDRETGERNRTLY